MTFASTTSKASSNEQAADLGISKVFIQPGAGSEDILNFCEEKNIEVFLGCVMVENGGPH